MFIRTHRQFNTFRALMRCVGRSLMQIWLDTTGLEHACSWMPSAGIGEDSSSPFRPQAMILKENEELFLKMSFKCWLPAIQDPCDVIHTFLASYIQKVIQILILLCTCMKGALYPSYRVTSITPYYLAIRGVAVYE